MTISEMISNYLESVKLTRSENTFKTYSNAIHLFSLLLKERWLDPENTSVEQLSEEAISWFAVLLKNYASATEHLYLQAVKGFFEFLAAEKASNVNLPRIKLLIKQRSRRSGVRLPQFPREEIEMIIANVDNHRQTKSSSKHQLLRALRDRAFIITLADTGLRVHEACGLKRGDLDWNEGKAIIIGKGNKQAVLRFSSRSIKAIKDYLQERSSFDGKSGVPLASLPLFARHDRGAGSKVKPITTTTGRNIVADWVVLSLGEDARKKITPHSFRHYFVTTVLRASGNLKLAQELARHTNISVTQRYAHLSDDELDKGYLEIFDKPTHSSG